MTLDVHLHRRIALRVHVQEFGGGHDKMFFCRECVVDVGGGAPLVKDEDDLTVFVEVFTFFGNN